MSMPPVRTLSQIDVGESAEAHLVRDLLATWPDGDVQAALTAVADRTLHSPWTVYRWLRGTNTPNQDRVVKVLRLMLVERQVVQDREDASALSVQTA